MTENEAIEILDEIQTVNDSLTQYIPNFDEAIDISKKALEKQNEKKPIIKRESHTATERYRNDGDFRCPTCNKRLRVKYHERYCCGCGQKLSWEEIK